MTGRRGNPLVLRKILPNPDLVIASAGADIGFYIVSLVGQVILNSRFLFPCNLTQFSDESAEPSPMTHSRTEGVGMSLGDFLKVISFFPGVSL